MHGWMIVQWRARQNMYHYLERLRRNWFLCGIVLVIAAAKAAPYLGASGGPIRPEYSVKYVAVFVIFLNSGLSIKSEQFAEAFFQLEVHAFVQLFTLGFIPLFVYFLVHVLQPYGVNPDLLTGLQIVSCMPPPVSSAVILTKAVGGNEAVAIFNSAFGSFLGIVVTPILLLMVVGVSSAVPLSKIFFQLTATVVVPILIGNFIRRNFKEELEKRKIDYSSIGQCILLLIIYSTFCDTFSKSDINLDTTSLLQVAAIVILMQLSLLALSFTVTTNENFGISSSYQPKDVVAIIFCATHKSLTLGIPMMKIIYHGDPSLPLLSIPLLFYHPTQILLGGLLVPKVRTWMLKAEGASTENV